jgi:hypothetical protein
MEEKDGREHNAFLDSIAPKFVKDKLTGTFW